MKSILCPNCGAPLEIEEAQTVVTCPYCSVTSKIEEKEPTQSYILPVKFDINKIRTELIGDLLKNPGTPQDLHSSLRIKKYELKFIPYWVVTVHNHTEYFGLGEYAAYSHRYRDGYKRMELMLKPEQGVFDDERELTIYAAPDVNNELLNFEIATRGKRYFQKQEIEKEGATLVKSVIDINQAKLQAVNMIREIHKGLILKEIVQINEVRDNPEITDIYLLHIPFYFIDFEVNGKLYHAIMEANTGRTVITDIPRKISYIIRVVTLGVFFIITAIIGLLLFLKTGLYFSVYLLITGVALGVMTFYSGLKHKYKEKVD